MKQQEFPEMTIIGTIIFIILFTIIYITIIILAISFMSLLIYNNIS